MTVSDETRSPGPGEVTRHYASGYEAGRLSSGSGRIQRERLLGIARAVETEPSLLGVSALLMAVADR